MFPPMRLQPRADARPTVPDLPPEFSRLRLPHRPPEAAGDQALAASVCCLSDRHQPQHLARPSLVSMDFTPSAGLSVTRLTPVSKKSLPSVGLGFVPSLA